jgi:hypothetical protein
LVEKFGAASFNRTLLFDEYATLQHSLDYYKKSLNFQDITVVTTENFTEDDKKAAEQAMPGTPAYYFANI